MPERIIDFHAHAFPDELAPRAMKVLLEEAPDVNAYLDGTIAALLDSMDGSGIEKSLVSCIATRPTQFRQILDWCSQIHSERILTLPSVHPADPDCLDRITLIKAAGFKGIKMHPYYQDFYADEKRLFAIYERLCAEDMLIVMHTGYDIAFPRIRRADPERLVAVKQAFPDLKLVTTHLGAWMQWDEAKSLLIGRDIYMEISFAMEYLPPDEVRTMIMDHPPGYVLFGTDSPWTDQKKTLALLNNLRLPEKRLKRILWTNAADLLGLDVDATTGPV